MPLTDHMLFAKYAEHYRPLVVEILYIYICVTVPDGSYSSLNKMHNALCL